jgi:hypothetical protein
VDFKNRPLAALDAIYRFPGGLRAVSQVDLASPIQLVHDVSDEASRTQVVPSSWATAWDTVAGSTTVYASRTVAEQLAADELALRRAGLTPETAELWVLGFGAEVDTGAANFETARFGVRSLSALPVVIASAANTAGKMTATSGNPILFDEFQAQGRLPMKLKYLSGPGWSGDMLWAFRSTAGGACDGLFTVDLLWMPPGSHP